MMRCFGLSFALCLIALTAGAQPSPKKLCGIPQVGDGDSIVIGDTSFRLHGIDAPETYQQCLDPNCTRTTSGIETRDRLNAHIAGREVCCVDMGSGGFDRRAGVCSADGEDLNAWLVREGLALASEEHSNAYVGETGRSAIDFIEPAIGPIPSARLLQRSRNARAERCCFAKPPISEGVGREVG